MPPEVQLLVIVLAFVGFWLIVIRPARNAQRRTADLQRSVSVGDEVILTSGIFGTVRTLTEDKVGLEVAEGLVLTVARQAILRAVPDESGAESGAESEAEQDHPTDEPAADHSDDKE